MGLIKRYEVEKVTSYKTSDGALHESSMIAEAFQNRLDFSAWCRANICIGGEWDAMMVANEIMDHWQIRPIPGRIELPDDDIPF